MAKILQMALESIFLVFRPYIQLYQWIFKPCTVLEVFEDTIPRYLLDLAEIQDGGIIQDGRKSVFPCFSVLKMSAILKNHFFNFLLENQLLNVSGKLSFVEIGKKKNKK
jgi:hypothetical protein